MVLHSGKLESVCVGNALAHVAHYLTLMLIVEDDLESARSNTRSICIGGAATCGRPALEGLLDQDALADPAPAEDDGHAGLGRAGEGVQAIQF